MTKQPVARNYFKSYLQERQLTQDEFAKLAGISRVEFNGIINGRLKLSDRNIDKIVMVLDDPTVARKILDAYGDDKKNRLYQVFNAQCLYSKKLMREQWIFLTRIDDVLENEPIIKKGVVDAMVAGTEYVLWGADAIRLERASVKLRQSSKMALEEKLTCIQGPSCLKYVSAIMQNPEGFCTGWRLETQQFYPVLVRHMPLGEQSDFRDDFSRMCTALRDQKEIQGYRRIFPE